MEKQIFSKKGEESNKNLNAELPQTAAESFAVNSGAENYIVPRHVGIIMDGNGRWATARGRERSYGHKKGAAIIPDVIDKIFNKGTYCLSLYALSAENLARPEKEVKTLLSILQKGIKKEGERAVKNGVRFVVSGDKSVLGDKARAEVDQLENQSAACDGHILNICFNYGSRQELCRAFSLMQKNGETEVTPETVNKYLYTAALPDVDLVIRTGGEKRLSNFLLWQSSYAELYFCDVLWPDFSSSDINAAYEWFSSRKRRFGKA